MLTVPVALRLFIDPTTQSSFGAMFAMSIVSLLPLFIIFLVVGVGLGWCGGQLPDAPVVPGMPSPVLFDGALNSYLWLTRLFTAYYFLFFFVIMPLVGLKETPLPIPATISEPVLTGADAVEQKG